MSAAEITDYSRAAKVTTNGEFMYFAILGPVEMHGARGTCEPASPMSRQVLSLLLAHANHVVTLESLVEELWGDAPPRLARKTVQTYIYHVRKALREGAEGTEGTVPADGAEDQEPVRLETESRGYRLRVPKGHLDLWRFEELCAGRAGRAEQGGRPRHVRGVPRSALPVAGAAVLRLGGGCAALGAAGPAGGPPDERPGASRRGRHGARAPP
ncbi:hypothetical protein ACVWXU_003418 [Streptomyces sp. TE33382]